MKELDTIKIKEENKQVRSYMIDMLIMIAACAIMAIYQYGFRALMMVIVSILTAVLCEASVDLVRKRKPQRLGDLSAVFTGAAIALMLPASAPMWLAPVGSAFAIFVAKLPFGNAKTTLFVPAAAGFAFLSLSYRDLVFTYPSVTVEMQDAITGQAGFVQGNSIASMLSHSTSIGTSVLDVIDMFVGRVAGPMGTSCLFVMLGLFIYMLIRRSSEWITSASFLAACSILAVIFPRVLTGRSVSLVMEMSAGMLFFAAIFFISDPATSPKEQMSRVLYGFIAGILTMVLRYFGAFEEGVCFFILIMNALSTNFESLGEKLNNAIAAKNNSTEKKPKDKKKKAKDSPKTEGGYSL
ncbi:MAG: RnfABCDGE type electron transport complex subunit D [Oscillospiraceae bacterium]